MVAGAPGGTLFEFLPSYSAFPHFPVHKQQTKKEPQFVALFLFRNDLLFSFNPIHSLLVVEHK